MLSFQYQCPKETESYATHLFQANMLFVLKHIQCIREVIKGKWLSEQ